MRILKALFLSALLVAAVAPAGAAEKKEKAKEAAAATTTVDLNTASEKQLEDLQGVGKSTAKKIIAGRPYASVDDLAKAGVSKGTIEKIRPLVTVGASSKPAPAAAPAPKAAPAKSAAPAKAAAPAAAAPAGPVDLNTASEKQLEDLPGVGKATAKKIIGARPIASVDDLSKAGVSKPTIEKIRPLVTAGKSSAPAPSGSAPAAAPVAAPVKAAAPAAVPAAAPMASPAKAAGASRTTAPKLAPGEKVNLNAASREELEKLPGIGPVKAQAIIDARPFSSPEDVMKVKGIKQGEFAKIKDLITVR